MATLLTFKVALLGDSAVGKTSIVDRYINNSFRENYLPSLAADFVTKRFPPINNKLIVQFHIWDLAGQYEYKLFRRQYLQGTHYSIIVVDAADERTWDIKPWIQEHELYAEMPTNFVLVVNKIDKLDDVQLNKIKLIFELRYPNMKTIFTSAKVNANIEKVFDYIQEELLKTI